MDQKWISVTEKLPMENGSYLVWMPSTPEGCHIAVAEWCGSYWNIKTPITAWMQLPKPYQEENHESDLINRKEVIAHFQRTKEASSTNGQYNEGFVDGLDFCIAFISTLPPAHSKRGQWISRMTTKDCEYAGWICSNCSYGTANSGAYFYNYCPNCGAKMRSGHDTD